MTANKAAASKTPDKAPANQDTSPKASDEQTKASDPDPALTAPDPKPEIDDRGRVGDTAPDELDKRQRKAEDGRPACRFKRCERPEFVENAGLCGGHWALRPDLRKAARRD